jgi:hypothetical protein
MGDDERSEHVEQADRLERELGDMERQSDRVGAEIDTAREDWEHKKNDPSVPGARDPGDDAGEAGPQGEAEGP